MCLFHYLNEGGGGEGEVDVGYDGGGGEGDAQAAGAGAAHGQEFAFDGGAVVGDAHAASDQVGEVVGVGGVEGDALVGCGGCNEVGHLAVADDHGLPVGVAFDVEVFHAVALPDEGVDVGEGVVDEKYVGNGRGYGAGAPSATCCHTFFHRHEECGHLALYQFVAVMPGLAPSR